MYNKPTSPPQAYPEAGKANFPSIEEKILQRWLDDGTFEKSIDQRPADQEFTFNDGPPFANGLPHHGHLLTGYVKDVIPRYQAMKGNKVTRRFGWDCHGLPAEMEAEKELPVSGRAASLTTALKNLMNIAEPLYSDTPTNGKKLSPDKHDGLTSTMTIKPWIETIWNRLCGHLRNSGIKDWFMKPFV